MVDSLTVVLGPPSKVVDDGNQQMAVWQWGPAQWVAFSRWTLGFRVEACFPSAMRRGEWSLNDHNLNAALREALLWLADRDVFLPARSS